VAQDMAARWGGYGARRAECRSEAATACHGTLCEDENVSGGGHNYNMSAIHITSADTCPVLGLWFLTKAPLVYVDPSGRLR
jgi:hypothetical protein